ncbi:FG-GAP-like repeat-containing protein [Streptomyces sp. SAS_272]|uniref:FG-GAP-like repeat-containing protein n=1 Tax=Streptomyces sp. SAS_272 TaxID=3412747 RepID=UPI00403C9E75
MTRHACARLRLVAACVVLSLPLAVGPAAGTASADPGAYRETVIPATMRVTPGLGLVATVGASGFLHRSTSGDSELVWTGVDGTDRKLAGTSPRAPVEYYGAASDVVALPPSGATGDVQLRNMVTDETTTVTVPAGQRYSRTIGTTVVTEGGIRTDGTRTEVHLLTAENGTTVDRAVTGLPEGASLSFALRAGVHGLLSWAKLPGEASSRDFWIDLATAQATYLPTGTVYGNSVVTAHHLVTPQAGGVRIYEQGRFDTPVREVSVRLADSKVIGVVGEALIVARHDSSLGDNVFDGAHYKVVAVPFDGSGERVLLARAAADHVVIRPDGGVQLLGGRTAQEYGYQAVTAGADGAPYATLAVRIPPVPMAIQRLTVDQGRVRTLEYGDRLTSAYERPLADAAPGYGERARIGSPWSPNYRCYLDEPCPELYATGDGRTVYRGSVTTDGGLQPALSVVGKGGAFPGTPLDTGLEDSYGAGRNQTSIVGASGNLLLVDGVPVGGGLRELRVVDIDSGKVLHREPGRVGAIWGTTVWSAATGATVTAKDARTGTSLTSFAVDTGCTSMTELQAVGRRLYWRCNTNAAPYLRAGVYDLQSRRSIPLASLGEAFLGDGVVAVREEEQGLVLYGLETGTAVRRWSTDAAGLVALDPRSGDLAYSRDQSVHVLRTGRPEAALVSPYRNVASRVETDATPVSWSAEWWLSEPAASWKVEIRHRATGRVVATRTGGAAEYAIATTWDGRGTTGGLLSNGSYTWTLTARPANGPGAALVQSATVRLTGGTAVRRDHAGGSALPDGVGDLLTLDSTGALAFQQGDGAGKFAGTVSGSGWSASVRAVPVGDLDGDRCNDVLVRLSTGALRLYKPACGAALKSTTPYTTVASGGFQQFDVLTSPGDVNKDGRPDLIARNPSTGKVYLYRGTSTGRLAAPVKLYDDWRSYKKVVGVGDLNGDGIGDLLAQDTSNNLYRFLGRGNGTFSARVKLFAGWGGTYDAVVGAGDITGDGKADLVARDTGGNLYRQNGTGSGAFGARVKIGAGWQKYKGVF